MKRNVLGKGLDALLPKQVIESSLRKIDIDLIKPNSLQPRMRVASAHIDRLAASISKNGILQPIVVRQCASSDEYEIIAGERRWRAAQRAGLAFVPAIVQKASDEKMLELALVENLQRENLNAIEEAHAYHALVEKFHLSHESVAERVGKSRSSIANSLRLLNLQQKVQQMLMEGLLSMGHARALLSLPPNEQKKLAVLVAKRSISVRQTENLVQQILNPAHAKRPGPIDPNIQAAQQRLEERFHTKIEIQQQGKKAGRVVFYFHNNEELQRLFEMLVT